MRKQQPKPKPRLRCGHPINRKTKKRVCAVRRTQQTMDTFAIDGPGDRMEVVFAAPK